MTRSSYRGGGIGVDAGMTTTAWVLLGVMVCFTASALLLACWAKQHGHFDEDVKYRVLEDDER